MYITRDSDFHVFQIFAERKHNTMMAWMNIFGGLAIFIFGMKLMSDGLQQVAGAKMRSILSLFSSNRFVGVLSGAVVTSVVQSSSATTVMIIGFINAGLLTLQQSLGIIFGANIGTTITAQLVAFKIDWVIMPAIITGLILIFLNNRTVNQWGWTVIGFGFLFLGMETMSAPLKAFSENETFIRVFQTFNCAPVDGVIPLGALLGAIGIGVVATLLLQSSSATGGIVIALAASGLLDIYTGVAIVLGSNIGTTVTAQLAALTANRVAKQAATAHTLFNCIGVLIILVSFLFRIDGEPVFFKCVAALSGSEGVAREVANAHTIFNVVTTLLLLPIIPLLAKICEKLIPVEDEKVKYQRLEPHLLDTPSIALAQTVSALRKMLKRSWKNVNCTLNMYSKNDNKNKTLLAKLEEREADIDARQQDIADYLSKLMLRNLNSEEANQIPLLLHCTNDAERIGDHASIVRSIMETIKSNQYSFSAEGTVEFENLHKSLNALAKMAANLLESHDPKLFAEANRMKRELSGQLAKVEADHMSRVNQGTCLPEVSILYLELLEEINKVSRHLFNIVERAGMLYERLPRRTAGTAKGKNRPNEIAPESAE